MPRSVGRTDESYSAAISAVFFCKSTTKALKLRACGGSAIHEGAESPFRKNDNMHTAEFLKCSTSDCHVPPIPLLY